MFAELD